MNKETIFIFEAASGMILASDIVLPDGHLIAKAGTILNAELITRISNYHILEIDIYTGVDEVHSKAERPKTYYESVRESNSFKQFNQKYVQSIQAFTVQLNDIVSSNEAIDTDKLLNDISGLISSNTNSLHLFDMLHSMREFDDLTYVHCINVALISSIIGKWLNYSQQDINVLTLCGLLHDIGKILIPNNILSKPGKLTDEEYGLIKEHVNLGYDKLKSRNIDSRIKEACLLHHERCDGSGYPFQLKSDKIPVFAKIVSIADVYDAMTSSRVYRGSMCPFQVVKLMEADAFDKFDPNYLLPFLNNVVSSYLHTNVKLSDGRTGEVVLINNNSFSLPTVRCGNEFIDLSKQHGLIIESVL